MGDLAEEIEQMQNEINAFDDKLDALDANGDDGRKDEESPKKSIFSRLGSSGDVVRKSSTGEDNQSDGEEEGELTSPSKRRKSSVKSAVVDTSNRRRPSEISKDDIKKAQLGNEAGKRRASRMFKNLLGTLRTFDEKTKSESVSSKRAEIDRKVEERVAQDRKKVIEEKKQLLIKKREKEKLLELLESKKEFSDLRVGWEENVEEQSKYIRTLTKPQIYWKPRIMDAEAKELQQKTKQKLNELLEESKTEWDSYRSELASEIKDIKDRNQFKDIELRVDGVSKPAGRPPIGRLVITKSIKNDQRIVQPKSSNGRVQTKQQTPTTPDENGSRKTKEERKQKEKERRKEIENARKRRHKSASESESDEYQERPRKLNKKIDEKIITKDVRRVAPKEETKPEVTTGSTNILPSTTRRISLKTTKKPDLEMDDSSTRRRVAKKSESQNTSSDKRGSSNSSNSSSSNSSESDSCNRTPTKSG